MFNILITGGSGLLGSEINIKNALKPSSQELNLLDYCSLRRYIQLNKITKIIHCAAKVGGVEANRKKNFTFFHDNLQMNANILKACEEFQLDKSIFILSTCVFPQENFPYTEEALHQGEPHPTNFGYAYGKRMLEVGSRALYEQYGLRTMCLIPCNLYGKNDNYNVVDGHVIPGLIHKCFQAQKNYSNFSVWGNGNALREFMYVEDLARIIERIESTVGKLPSKMIISPGKEHSIREVVQLIAKKFKFNGNIVFDETMPNGILRKPSDNTIFRNYFPDFEFTDLEKGINDTINWFTAKYPQVRL